MPETQGSGLLLNRQRLFLYLSLQPFILRILGRLAYRGGRVKRITSQITRRVNPRTTLFIASYAKLHDSIVPQGFLHDCKTYPKHQTARVSVRRHVVYLDLHGSRKHHRIQPGILTLVPSKRSHRRSFKVPATSISAILIGVGSSDQSSCDDVLVKGSSERSPSDTSHQKPSYRHPLA